MRSSTETFSEDVIASRLNLALQKLTTKDIKLFQIDVNERTLSYKLGAYLAEEFPGWDVDYEYNRDGIDIKRMPPHTVRSKDHTSPAVCPDIIIHRRGTHENLVAIETKKDNNAQGAASDRRRLALFKNHPNGYRYVFAVLVIFNISAAAPAPFYYEFI